MEKINKSRRALTAGLAATIAMTALMYLAPLLGMPKMDIAAMLGHFLTRSEAIPYNGPWSLGMLVHFINGVFIFPFIYVFAVFPRISNRPTVVGLAYGAVLWFVAQAAVMPLVGAGFFSGNSANTASTVVASLLGHLIYGGILGKMIGNPVERPLPDSSLSVKK